MLKALIQTRLWSLYSSLFARLRQGKQSAGKRVLIGIFAVYIIGCLFYMFGAMIYGIAVAVAGTELEYLIFIVAGLMAVALNVIGCVFTAEKQLYDARDNELLLSMPIPPWMILFSRMLLLWLMNLVFTLVVMLPTAAVSIALVHLSPLAVFMLLVGTLLLPLFYLALVCLFGGLVAFVSSRLRSKNLVTYLFLLAFMGGYFWFYSHLNSFTAHVLQQGESLATAMRRVVPPVYWFAELVSKPSFGTFGMLILWTAPIMALVYWVLSKSFAQIVTRNRGLAKVRYREKRLKTSSPVGALLKKELHRLFTLPMYLFNCGFGVVMELALAVILLIKGPSITAMVPELTGLNELLPAILIGILCFMAMTVTTTSVSLSLEGHRFWIIRSLPVSTADIFRVKILTNLVLAMPPLAILQLAAILTVPMDLSMMVLLLLIPQVLQVFTALFGLCANLWLPRFEWINETVVIKQSGSVMVSMLGGMALVFTGFIAYLFAAPVLGTVGYLLVIAVISIAAMGGAHAYLFTKGIRLYEKL